MPRCHKGAQRLLETLVFDGFSFNLSPACIKWSVNLLAFTIKREKSVLLEYSSQDKVDKIFEVNKKQGNNNNNNNVYPACWISTCFASE